MDKTFNPASTQPPEGKIIELWSGGRIVRGCKRNGTWFTENGTRVMADGWRLIEKPVEDYGLGEHYDPKPKPPQRHARANKITKKAKKKK